MVRVKNSYLRLEKDAVTGKPHPLLAGLEEVPRIINGVWRVEVEPAGPLASLPLTLIPSYPDLPMEKVYPRVTKTGIAQVFLREFGQGRVVYFPFDIDRAFWEVLSVDHGLLLRQRGRVGHERRAAGHRQRPRRAGRDDLAAAGLNDHSPGQSHQPDDDERPVPRVDSIGPQQVRIRLPSGATARAKSACSRRTWRRPSNALVKK